MCFLFIFPFKKLRVLELSAHCDAALIKRFIFFIHVYDSFLSTLFIYDIIVRSTSTSTILFFRSVFFFQKYAPTHTRAALNDSDTTHLEF